MLLPLLLLTAQVAGHGRPPAAPGRAASWVDFSAELRIEHPTRPLAFGRYVQDEHGCSRRETVHPDGSLMVNILNFETEKIYRLMRGNWTSHPMRLIPDVPRRPPTRQVQKKVAPIEGYEAYLTASDVQGPRGNYTREAIVIPALNYFEAVVKHGNGEAITAQPFGRVRPIRRTSFRHRARPWPRAPTSVARSRSRD